LGRCYWDLSGELPPGSTLTPGQYLAAAQREYKAALAAATDEAAALPDALPRRYRPRDGGRAGDAAVRLG
jgi:hypothetical protein